LSGVRIGEERRNVLRGEGSNWREGSIFQRPGPVKSIFELFLGWHPCFVGFTPEFRLFSRTGAKQAKVRFVVSNPK